ncbi:MAG: hypothetical protein ACRC1K_19615, partial [Planctomycetia bacterium]
MAQAVSAARRMAPAGPCRRCDEKPNAGRNSGPTGGFSILGIGVPFDLRLFQLERGRRGELDFRAHRAMRIEFNVHFGDENSNIQWRNSSMFHFAMVSSWLGSMLNVASIFNLIRRLPIEDSDRGPKTAAKKPHGPETPGWTEMFVESTRGTAAAVGSRVVAGGNEPNGRPPEPRPFSRGGPPPRVCRQRPDVG